MMKKGYWVVAYRNDSDTEALKAYSPLVPGVMAEFGGKALLRGLPGEAPEAGEIKRTLVVEFPSLQHALDAYHSPSYSTARAELNDTIERDFRIVEGAE
jgi:uncharacterized protein (DUF1330 family)